MAVSIERKNKPRIVAYGAGLFHSHLCTAFVTQTKPTAMTRKRHYLKKLCRRSLIERVEKRIPLAGDIHNFLDPGDVNDDGEVRPSDALAIINSLTDSKQQNPVADAESVDKSVREMFPDVNDDGTTTASDALRVINELSSSDDTTEASERLGDESSLRVRIELELKGTDRAEFEVRVSGAPADTSHDVTVGETVVGQLTINDLGRGELELHYGPGNEQLPDDLRKATGDTPIAIGDLVEGTLGSLGELELSDGASDANSDAMSEANSDALSDVNSDGNSGALSDANSDGSTDGGADGSSDASSPTLAAAMSSSSSSSDDSTLSDANSDANSDALSDAESDANSDALSDANSDANSDALSDANSDADSDASSDANSDGGSD